MIKLIALDLDGTLLRDDKSISEKNIEAIHFALDHGVEVVITTGRPLAAINHILDQLDLNTAEHYSITYNGGLIIQNQTQKVMHTKTLYDNEVEKVANTFLSLDLPVSAVGDTAVYEFPYPDGHPSYYKQQMTFLPYQSIERDADGHWPDIFKFVIATEKEHLEAKLPSIPAAITERYEVMRSHPHQLELMPTGVDKGYGLSQMANILNFQQSEVMAIGDEENDSAMLQWAGTAVVMGNGREDIKELADYITASNMDDGVAQAIYHFVKA